MDPMGIDGMLLDQLVRDIVRQQHSTVIGLDMILMVVHMVEYIPTDVKLPVLWRNMSSTEECQHS